MTNPIDIDALRQLMEKATADLKWPATEELLGHIPAVLSELEMLRKDNDAYEQDLQHREHCVEHYKAESEKLATELEALRASRGRMVEALEKIAASRYGLQGIQEDYGNDTNAYNFQAMKYWYGQRINDQALARAALQPAEDCGEGSR